MAESYGYGMQGDEATKLTNDWVTYRSTTLAAPSSPSGMPAYAVLHRFDASETSGLPSMYAARDHPRLV
jgi:hypothetical protein